MVFLFRRVTILLGTIALLPFLLLLSLVLSLLNLMCSIGGIRARSKTEAPSKDSASIVVLNWNGQDLLAEGIPSVLEAVRADGRNHEVLVVDNGSDDGSVEYLRQNFPTVRVVALSENLGFVAGNNAGVRAASHEIVVLLNNDMIVESDFLRPLLDGFGPKTFAVSSQIYLQDPEARREETGKTVARFRRGMVDFSHSNLERRRLGRRYYPVLWAGGGSSAFHRGRFLELGGFSRLYSPAYVEDTDISFTAWLSGWEVLFAPGSKVYHKHRATSRRRFDQGSLHRLILRNQFLFIWKNLFSWKYLLSHCFFLPWNTFRLARDHGISSWKTLFQAFVRLPSVARAKLWTVRGAIRTDKEILGLFEQPFLNFYRPESPWTQRARREQPPTLRDSAPRESRAPRVLWLTAYLPHLGRHAGAARMFQLLKRMASNQRITLVSFLENDDERQFLAEVEELCERVIVLRRSSPERLQLFPYEPFEEFDTPDMRSVVEACLEDDDFDLMQLEYSQMACYADSRMGIPSLVTKHEVDFAACLRKARLERAPHKKVRWFYNYLQVLDREIRLLKRTDAAICMTGADAHELRKFCSTVPVHVVNTGVDLEYFQPAREPVDAPKMVFVGAFQHEPNVDAMVYFCRDVLPRIQYQIPEAQLTIVGSRPTPAVLALADIPGVHVTGWVADIRPYMSESAVYVVPLRLGVGIRGKILEAWGMSLAVVATSVACAGLNGTPGIHLAIADDSAAFAEKVGALLRNPAQRAELGRQGRLLAERLYGWEGTARQLERVYQEVTGMSRADSPLTLAREGGRVV